MERETKYQALASWLNYRLETWRTHRDINYIPQWDEYYRLWRGIWLQEDRTRQLNAYLIHLKRQNQHTHSVRKERLQKLRLEYLI